MEYKICAYITAYKDLNALKMCLGMLQQQSYPITNILVVDNSPEQIIFSVGSLIVKHFPENIGVAGGLKVAVLWAKSSDCDFLWTFDQDSEPEKNLLNNLLLKYDLISHENFQIGIIAPLPIDVSSQNKIHGLKFKEYKFQPVVSVEEETSFYECDILITSGSLLSMNAAKHSELPKEDLFLDAVDYYYCMGLKKAGYKIVIANNLFLDHNLGTPYKFKSVESNQEILTYTCSPLRYYYSCRNHTFFETRIVSMSMLHKSIFYRLNILKQHLIHISRYEAELKILKSWACVIGTAEGFFGKLGKTW